MALQETKASHGLSMASVRKRPRKEPDTAGFNTGDFQTLLLLPIFLVLAMCVSEARWHRGCIFLARFVAPAPAGGKTSLWKGSGIQDVVRARAFQLEHYVQVVKERLTGWRAHVVLEGGEHLVRAKVAQDGAVLWVAHFCFNALASKMALQAHGNRVHHISRAEHGFSKSRFGMTFLNPIRIGAEARYLASRIVIDRKDRALAMHAALRALKNGDFVSITAGAWEGQLISEVMIDGRVLELSTGAPRLAALAHCPLLPVFVVRDEMTSEIRVIIEAPLAIDPALPRDTMIQSVATQFAEMHQKYISRYPHQWRDWEKLQTRL